MLSKIQIIYIDSQSRLFDIQWTHFVTLRHITDLFLCHWIYGSKCLSTSRVHIFIIDEKLFKKSIKK